MRILVTGDAGWLGGHISKHLEDEGHIVVGFDLLPGDRIVGDLVDLKKEHLKGIEAVVHCAAIGDVYVANRNPALAFKASAEGTAALVAACPEDLKVFVHVSTWEVYGRQVAKVVDEESPCNPEHPYSAAKYAGELALRGVLAVRPEWRPAWYVLRIGSAYGPGMRGNALIPKFIERSLANEPLAVYGSGLQYRQWTWAGDVAGAVGLALGGFARSGIYNIVGDEAVTVRGLAQMLSQDIVYQDERLADPPCYMVRNDKAREALGWKPGKIFADGIKELLDEARRQGA